MADQKAHFYQTDVRWIGEKKGELGAPGLPTLLAATPPEFQGHPGIWSPEHLFVASVNVCLMSTFIAISQFSKFPFVSYQCRAEGKLEKTETGFQITEITLKPQINVTKEEDREKATKIIEKAEKNCLISNSVKSKIFLEPTILVGS